VNGTLAEMLRVKGSTPRYRAENRLLVFGPEYVQMNIVLGYQKELERLEHSTW
jgi:hypothetical protein